MKWGYSIHVLNLGPGLVIATGVMWWVEFSAELGSLKFGGSRRKPMTYAGSH
jgi:hypothetical protein